LLEEGDTYVSNHKQDRRSDIHGSHFPCSGS
jgi:hypothetical protein